MALQVGGINTEIIKAVENSLEIVNLARFAVDEYNKKLQNGQLQFVKVVKAKEQIVEGVIYYITLEANDGGEKKIYEAKIWDKPWQNFKQLEEFKLVDFVGGINESSTGVENNLEIDSLARFAVDEHNKKQNARLQFVKVVKAKEQIVEGVTYYITLEANDGGQKKTYEAKVWVKAWENFKELQEFKLVDDAVGGINESNGVENSLEIDILARFAVNEHNKKQNARLQFVKVVKAKEQIVEGVTYYITLEANDDGVKKTFEAKVWVKAWENLKELQEFKLVDDVVGGINESNGVENSLEIDILARFAVDEHNKKQNALLQFEKVVKTKEQVVKGVIYYITLEAIDGTGEKKIYEAKVWVKAWENFKELQEFKLLDAATSAS
ncbi:hypothetical protein SSX86_021693 [Deinandra increscens subsp. villosa]|uniref:Cysteine proteinase inhibitor n=1 Tax=Deinandra increscens subsp. villosa TaxID=3103831 RepID=A0AAP0CLS7_9ASTR